MKRNRAFKNSFFSVIQTVVLSVSTLILFKLMVLKVGLNETGVWSFLSSITAITSFGSFGFANALLYYIPVLKSRGETPKLNTLINTSFFSTAAFTSLLCAMGYAVFFFIIPHTVSQSSLATAYELLPIIVISFFFSGLSSTFLSALDGMNLMHVRAKIYIIGSLTYLTFAIILINIWGIAGVPLAQIMQNIFLAIAGYNRAKKFIPGYAIKWQFDRITFRSIFKYGFNFQIISITQIISDPFVKSMIIKYTGSAATAVFDICMKLLNAIRSLIIASNQTITPQITIFNTLKKYARIRTFYKANFQVVSLLGTILFLTPVALSQEFSLLLINTISGDFIFIICNVSIALFINTIAFPAYFSYMGVGNLKWNVISNVVAAVLMFVSAPVIGELFGGKYIVLGWAVSSVTGSIILIYNFGKEYAISAWSIFNKNIIYVIIAFIIATLINFYLNSKLLVMLNSNLYLFIINICVTILIVSFPIYHNDISKKIILKLKANLWKRA